MFAVVLAALLISAPGAMDSSVGGTPLGIVGYAALGIVFCTGAAIVFFPTRRPVGRWVSATLLLLVVAKAIAGLGDVPTGWQASYRYADTKDGWHDARFFWRLTSRPYRIDPVIGLSDVRSDLHFFNDVDLYGYPPYDATPREIRFPLEAKWSGYIEAGENEELTWLISAAGRVTVTTPAGVQTLEDPEDARVSFAASPGQHGLTVTYLKRAGQAPFIHALVIDAATDRGVPVASDRRPVRPWARGVTSVIVWAGIGLLVVSVCWALARHGTSAPPESLMTRAAGLASTIGLMGWGVVLAIAAYGSTAFFGAGGDPLFYGSAARDILHNGPLMLRGAPIGQASPYFFYPLYPYLLALGHVLVGDSVSAIYVVNGVLVALLPALFLALGWARLHAVAGVIAFAALTVFLRIYGSVVITFDQPAFTDIAYMTLVLATLVALARAFATPAPVRLVVAGVLMAFGAATRPSLMTLVYLAPIGLAFAIRPWSLWRWGIATAWLAAGVTLGLLPFTLRNAIAAGQFVVLVNSWIQIPYFLIPPEIAEKPGGMPGLGQAVLMAWGIFMEHPLRTILVEARKVLYTLGVTAAGPRDMLQAHGLVALPVLFGWAVLTRKLQGPTAAAVVTFAVSHLVAMVVAAPWTFHYKSILPLHAAFLFGAAFVLDSHQSDSALTYPPDAAPS